MANSSNGLSKGHLTTKQVALCGLLTCAMLVLGFIESLIPINAGIPGIKLGLSNCVLLFALYTLSAPTAGLLMLLKVVLSGLLFGGVSAMMYALAGGVVSMACMIVLKKLKFSVIAVSMVGAVAHNAGQVGLAMVLLKHSGLLYYLAVLALVGLGCGLLTGLCAKAVIPYFSKKTGGNTP